MKLYQQLEDPMADKMNMVRIVDESGEDYLYSNSLFIQVPAMFGQSIELASAV